jgi:hypothetical protein
MPCAFIDNFYSATEPIFISREPSKPRHLVRANNVQEYGKDN